MSIQVFNRDLDRYLSPGTFPSCENSKKTAEERYPYLLLSVGRYVDE